MSGKISLIIILTDVIRGHLNQSCGVTRWLEAETGASVVELTIPSMKKLLRITKLKLAASRLHLMSKRQLKRWFRETGSASLLEDTVKILGENNIDPRNCLVISAGSDPARFNLALGRLLGIKTCVLMTPSLLGTDHFDYAVVPGHDAPSGRSNLLVTLGAPNSIDREILKGESEKLQEIFPRGGEDSYWAILIGGDDANYRVGPEWVRKRLSGIMDLAEKAGAGLYITTSRRTPPETEIVLSEMTRNKEYVRMLLLASQNDYNPVPGMLGLCSRVFCTEDSVSMLSETVTAGHEVLLLRVERKKGIRLKIQSLTENLVKRSIISRRFLWGVPRFDTMIAGFEKRGFVRELPGDVSKWDMELIREQSRDTGFNEAKRAAEWIMRGWNS